MAAGRTPSVRPTPTTSRSPGEGVITGHLFKVAREQADLTQSELAECLAVDTTTVQAWEQARRPLTATRAGRLRWITRALLRHGAPAHLLPLFDEAQDADALIAHALSGHPEEAVRGHPLSSWVLTRETSHMLAWALKGVPPGGLALKPAARRGPSPPSPLLAVATRTAFFTHMRRAAELADRAGTTGALLRRQALYLCSYDTASDTAGWLAHMRHTVRHASGWGPYWADTRSLATSLTRHGDLEPLHVFIQRGMADDLGETANLNYWAYWLGVDRTPRSSDAFMTVRSDEAWDGLALLRRLTDRLGPDLACIDLNVHSVWALLAARRGLLAADPSLNRVVAGRVTVLLDGRIISRQARRELESLHYGLTLHT